MKLRFSYCVLLLLFLPLCTIAQRQKTNFELSLTNDNDMYVMTMSDYYYTNGLFINFLRTIGKDTIVPNILDIELGHSLYTGLKYVRNNRMYWDRQFLANFSLKTSLYRFIHEDKIIRYSLKLEQVGPRAYGKQIQNFIHDLFNMYEVEGWETQLPNSFGVDLAVQYEQEFLKSNNNVFAISSVINATVGTHNIHANVGLPLRLGKLKPFNKSVFTRGNLNDKEGNDEFYVFYQPSLTYQIKNSTFGDSYAVDDDMIYKNQLAPFILYNQLGVTYAKRNSALTFSLTAYNTEIKNLKHAYHQYGRLQYRHRF